MVALLPQEQKSGSHPILEFSDFLPILVNPEFPLPPPLSGPVSTALQSQYPI